MTKLNTSKKQFLQTLLADTKFREVRMTSYETSIINQVLMKETYSSKDARIINSIRKDYLYWMQGMSVLT